MVTGSNKWINKNEAQSCSGLAYHLLVVGGIKEFVTKPHLVHDIIVATSNNLAELVAQARKAELENILNWKG